MIIIRGKKKNGNAAGIALHKKYVYKIIFAGWMEQKKSRRVMIVPFFVFFQLTFYVVQRRPRRRLSRNGSRAIDSSFQ